MPHILQQCQAIYEMCEKYDKEEEEEDDEEERKIYIERVPITNHLPKQIHRYRLTSSANVIGRLRIIISNYLILPLFIVFLHYFFFCILFVISGNRMKRFYNIPVVCIECGIFTAINRI